MAAELAQRLLAALPQTQCARCGYPDCAAYAQALAQGLAAINQCPPGGAQGVARLAAITGQAPQPLNPSNAQEGPRSIAFIDEAWCIGCTRCIKVCPTDAIMGSNKRMHTVLEPYCTGCELCLPVCPVDCILLENVTDGRTGWAAWSQPQADQARERYALHQTKGQREQTENAEPPGRETREKREALADPAAQPLHQDQTPSEQKRSIIQTALARARDRRMSQADGDAP
ncbi:MAG: RnfABCDGE type electron transport complex subunit B [Betaproteobacteria bacterium]